MCLATAYIENDGQKEKVMQDVAWIRTESRGLQLTTLLGESKLLQASIKSIDLLKGTIVLEMTMDPSQVVSGDQKGGRGKEQTGLKSARRPDAGELDSATVGEEYANLRIPV